MGSPRLVLSVMEIVGREKSSCMVAVGRQQRPESEGDAIVVSLLSVKVK